ncbi:DUF6380 family protein [Streptomyces lancefieldiae]|uniref:DUF6380 family protein n=1 Tax=Streptomyces lancefieldiae TaxID=3075520 RepID=A0ABU3AHB9_9ACTN|nr:DUF6380 family protein [Streptomyces sp. DSM 40712]MDT0608942.1 DUF6380 family protein [Streptomyces sp. DSM 40712]
MATPDTPAPGDADGGQRRATLRWRAASLTETVGGTPFKHHTDHGDRTGKGAP